MPESATLAECIQQLRRNFHLKLSRKRGLSITEPDLMEIAESGDDAAIQGKLERLSFVRTLFQYIRERSA